ncbi:MAG TPA: hypothetical protein PLL72_20600, partial [Burkholderiaceae bacterium]|nr:hypothetical protein [Burkholderiaceae bacterium]
MSRSPAPPPVTARPAATLVPALEPVWQGAAALLTLLAVIDMLRSRLEAPPHATRRVNATLPLGVPCQISIHLAWHGPSPRAAWAIDHAPPGFECIREPAA